MDKVLVAGVTLEPHKCGGRPCVRGLRIRVSDILSLLAAGASHDEILADFPVLREEDIRAALAYAAIAVDQSVAPDA